MGELSCSGLSVVKGAFTLNVDSLRLARGEKVALLGENGCGKTTLLQVLAGLQAAGGKILYQPGPPAQTGGQIRWDALPPRERALYMSYLPQESELLFNLSVHELTALVLHRDKLLPDEGRRLALEALEMTGFEQRPYASLSGGEKRRAMLARVFCREAEFILLDEPTAALDLRHAAMFMRHAADIQAAVLAAVHDLNLALRYFDRFLLMKQGRILFDRRKDELDGAELEAIYGLGLTRCGDFFLPER